MEESRHSGAAVAAYWAQRYGNAQEAAAFVQAFSAVQAALAAGHTVAEAPEIIAMIDNPLLIGDLRRGQTAAPLLSDGRQLWLQRIWQAEKQLAADILARLAAEPPPLPLPADSLCAYTRPLNAEQQAALHHALSHCLSMINGGPGTGKTFTLAQLVALLAAAGEADSLALAAPTGKAAKRMESALAQALKAAAADVALAPAQTLHRLLGIGADGAAAYHRDKRLPYRVVIVDEASMLSLELAAQLFAAVADDARLILLGDADQLAAVEAGAVLQDLSRHPRLQTALVTLRQSRRFAADSGIGQLAQLVLQGAEAAALEACFAAYGDIERRDPDAAMYARLAEGYAPYFAALQSGQSAERLLALFDGYRILPASHHGPLGTLEINRRLRHIYFQQSGMAYSGGYFHGLPLMIGANDYRNEVFNGDIGLCLRGEDGLLRLHLPHKVLLLERLNPAHLQDAYALSIHKSQGSEFAHAALLLDPRQDKLLSRELLYTGITRAKTRLTVYAAEALLARASALPTRRSTGLAGLLSEGGKRY